MEFKLSNHAKQEMELRSISLEKLQRVLENPQQFFPIPGGKKIFQSKVCFENDKIYLIRAVVNDQVDPVMVITVYRTSKIDKYWRKP
jgi:hypothetical protein